MEHRLHPKKSLGQHFLRDDEVHEYILRAARLSSRDAVLEIGAGDGTLTRSLAELARRVVAVEADSRCVQLLQREFPSGGNVQIVEADILEFDLSCLAPLSPLKVVADLPYNIATAVLDRLLDQRGLFSLMVLMFQKEVALRLVASPGSKDYGSLSLATQYRADTQLLRTVPPQAFIPRPKVESAVVLVTPRSAPLLPAEEEKVFTALVRAGFKHRRKMFLNALARAGSPFERERVFTALQTLSLSPSVRAEEIGFDQYLRLARIIVESRQRGGGSSCTEV